MSLTHYNPWSLFDQLQHEMHRMPVHKNAENDNCNVATSEWVPAVDIKEEDNQYLLIADIPGVDPKDIESSMEKGVLTIKGKRQSEKREESENYRRVERQSGQFYRRFTLPDSADADKIEAKSEHGVLTVTIPKQEVAVSRRIEVKH